MIINTYLTLHLLQTNILLHNTHNNNSLHLVHLPIKQELHDNLLHDTHFFNDCLLQYIR